jgi:hypothetical protein
MARTTEQLDRAQCHCNIFVMDKGRSRSGNIARNILFRSDFFGYLTSELVIIGREMCQQTSGRSVEVWLLSICSLIYAKYYPYT